MKIIEGTAEEVLKYYNEGVFSKKGTFADKTESYQLLSLKNTYHWSNGKSCSIPIKEMSKNYILNVLRKMFKEETNDELLEESEFESLILNLADKIIDDL